MQVRDLRDGTPGGWVGPEALKVDRQGSVWVDLDAPVELQVDPEADLLSIRGNRELFADESGLKLGPKSSIEVPAEDLAGREFACLSSPNTGKWERVALWRPWSYSWTLNRLPARE